METKQCAKYKRVLFLDEFKVNKGGKVTKTCKNAWRRQKRIVKSQNVHIRNKGHMQRLWRKPDLHSIERKLKYKVYCKDCVRKRP